MRETKILDCQMYKDGGTFMIETDRGRYWMPHHSIGIWKGENYFKQQNVEIVDNEDEISDLMKALAHDSMKLQWIKRHVK